MTQSTLIAGAFTLGLLFGWSSQAQALTDEAKKGWERPGNAWAALGDDFVDRASQCNERCEEVFEQRNHTPSGLDDCHNGCGHAGGTCQEATATAQRQAIGTFVQIEEFEKIIRTLFATEQQQEY